MRSETSMVRLLAVVVCVNFIFYGCSQGNEQIQKSLAPGDTVSLSILTTTDLHGWILPWDYAADVEDARYGLAKVATLIDSVRNVQPHTLLLDAGDWLQGNQLAAFYASVDKSTPYYPLLKVAEHLKYDAFVIGNHEFNFGIDYLRLRMEQSPSIAYLAANAKVHGTMDPAFDPFIIRNVGGINVAVIGLTTPGSAIWDRPRVEGLIDFVDGVETGRRYVDLVRNLGAELIVVLAHSGLESGSSYHDPSVPEENFGRKLLEEVPGIDVYVFGHSHRVTSGYSVITNDSTLIPVIQAGRWGSHLGEAQFKITRLEDGTLKTISVMTNAFSVRDVVADPEIVLMAQPYHEATRGYVNKPLATTEDHWSASNARLQDTPIIDLIHRVQLDVTGAQLSAAAAFNISASFGPGTISRKDMANIYPYENMLYTLEINGKQLRDFLEHSARYYTGISGGEPVTDPRIPGFNFDTAEGVDYIINLRNPIGSRITTLTYEGRPVQDDDTFTIAINSYRAEGGGNYFMLSEAPVIWRSDISVREYLELFLEQIGVVSHKDVFNDNWSISF